MTPRVLRDGKKHAFPAENKLIPGLAGGLIFIAPRS
jgi:hypothetical protein